MTRHSYILFAAAGSLALLMGAYGFQYLGEMAPCKLCYWQRYPHMAAIGIGVFALMVPGRVLPFLGATAALSSAAIGVYHTGVERAWWQGPTTCSSGPVGGLSTNDLFDQIMAAPLVRCDEIAWEMLGLSMASWNAIASLGLVLLWLAAMRQRS